MNHCTICGKYLIYKKDFVCTPCELVKITLGVSYRQMQEKTYEYMNNNYETYYGA